VRLPETDMRNIRGRRMAMIFQEPMLSLNPVMPVGDQIAETLKRHTELAGSALDARVLELLDAVRIPDARRRIHEYPFQLSGGMKQRVMIAIALACDPELLIADEPTTALDVTIQAQILDLILELQERLGTAVVLITHDLGVVAETAQRVIVMYGGRKVEEAAVEDLFEQPQHPYTHGLLAAVPHLAALGGGEGRHGRLTEIPGMVPALVNLPKGCTFAPRCAFATDLCHNEFPPYEEKRPRHMAACWHSDRLYGGVNA